MINEGHVFVSTYTTRMYKLLKEIRKTRWKKCYLKDAFNQSIERKVLHFNYHYRLVMVDFLHWTDLIFTIEHFSFIYVLNKSEKSAHFSRKQFKTCVHLFCKLAHIIICLYVFSMCIELKTFWYIILCLQL